MALAYDSPRIPNGNGDALWKGRDTSKFNQCECCPYGYHIDLDFVRFCENVSQRSDATLNRERRRERRRQRQSMEVLLGLTSQSFWNIEQQLPKIPQEEAVVVAAPCNSVETSNLVRDALHKAVQDFEDTLERTHKAPVTHILDGFTEVQAEVGGSGDTSLSSMSAVSSPVTPQDVDNAAAAHDNLLQDFDVASVGSATSAHSHAALQNVRQQMALSLERMRDLEDQVKLIPVLQVQLAVAKEEKRKMQLRLREQQMKKDKNKTDNDIELTNLASGNTHPSMPSTSAGHLSTSSVTHVGVIDSFSADVSRTDITQSTEQCYGEGTEKADKDDVQDENLKKTEDWFLNRQVEEGEYIDPGYEIVARRSVSSSSLAAQARNDHDFQNQFGNTSLKQGWREKTNQGHSTLKHEHSNERPSCVSIDKPKVILHPSKVVDPGLDKRETDKEIIREVSDRRSRPRERTASCTEGTTKEPSPMKSKAIRDVGVQTLPPVTNNLNDLDDREQGGNVVQHSSGSSILSSQATIPSGSSVSLRTMDLHHMRHGFEQNISDSAPNSDIVTSISIKAFENFISQYECVQTMFKSLHPKIVKREEQVEAYTNILNTLLEKHGFTEQSTLSGIEKSHSQPLESSAKSVIQEQCLNKTSKIQKISLQTLGGVRLPVEAQERRVATRGDASLEDGQLPAQTQEEESPYERQLVDTSTNEDLCKSCLRENKKLEKMIDSSMQTSEENIIVQKGKKVSIDSSTQTSKREPHKEFTDSFVQTSNFELSRKLTDSSVQTSNINGSAHELLSLKDLERTESQNLASKNRVNDIRCKSAKEECTVTPEKEVKPFSCKTIDNSSQYDENDCIEGLVTSTKIKSKLNISEMESSVKKITESEDVKKDTLSTQNHASDETRAPVSLALLSQPLISVSDGNMNSKNAVGDKISKSQKHLEISTFPRHVKSKGPLKPELKIMQKEVSVQTDSMTENVSTVLGQIQSSDIFKYKLKNIQKNASIQTDDVPEKVHDNKKLVEHGVGESSTHECCTLCGASPAQTKRDPRKRSRSQDGDSKIPRPAPPTENARKLLRQSTYTKIEVPEAVELETTQEGLWTSHAEIIPKSEVDLTATPSLPASLSEDKPAVVSVDNVMLIPDGSRQRRYGAVSSSTPNFTSETKSLAAGSNESPSTPKIKITGTRRTQVAQDDTSISKHDSTNNSEQDSNKVVIPESSSRNNIATNSTNFTYSTSEDSSESSRKSQTFSASSLVKMEDMSSKHKSNASVQSITYQRMAEVHKTDVTNAKPAHSSTSTQSITRHGPVSETPQIARLHESPLQDGIPSLPRPFASPSLHELTQENAKRGSAKGDNVESRVLPSTMTEKNSISPSATGKGSKCKSAPLETKLDDTKSEVTITSPKKSAGSRTDRPALKETSSPKLGTTTQPPQSSSQSLRNREYQVKEDVKTKPTSSSSTGTDAVKPERPQVLRHSESSLSGKQLSVSSQHIDASPEPKSYWDTAQHPQLQQSSQPTTAGLQQIENHGDANIASSEGLLQPSREEILKLSERERPKKVEPSTKMKAALKVVNDLIEKSQVISDIGNTAKAANTIIQREWFQVSSTPSADPHIVEDYLDHFEEMSSALLTYVVNMADKAGNTAMHYALSQGNFDVVSILLDSKVCNINLPNAAGYTAVMLVSLAQIRSDTHRCVLQRFLADADVNVRAQQHGQTALMLAVSHNRLDMVQLLIEGGADLNIQDDDGSTALMCAAEHGHAAIVQFLISQPDTDLNIKDVDGLTALDIALDAGHKDVGILLYAHKHFSRNNSPYSSLRGRRSKSATPTTRTASTPPPKTPSSPLPARHNPRHSHD